jgi:hypothetical protein
MARVLPQPITNTDVYLGAVLDALIELNERMARMENELQRLNTVATQKPSIQLDATKVANQITNAMQQPKSRSKGV